MCCGPQVRTSFSRAEISESADIMRTVQNKGGDCSQDAKRTHGLSMCDCSECNNLPATVQCRPYCQSLLENVQARLLSCEAWLAATGSQMSQIAVTWVKA